MGMFKEKQVSTTQEKPNQELADAYEAIAALHEQVATLTATVEALKGGAA
jgi:ubiquinone biosynthesis protein UbiJ